MASSGSQASLARSFRPVIGVGLALPMSSALSWAKRARRERSFSQSAGSEWRRLSTLSPGVRRRRRKGTLRSARVSAILPMPHSALAPQTLNGVGR
ncbi:hypothetical protein D9M68_694040 [compost metagenome]